MSAGLFARGGSRFVPLFVVFAAACGSTSTTQPRNVRASIAFPALPGALVSAGGGHTFAPIGNGVLNAWGDDQSGQLGDGRNTIRGTAAPGPSLGPSRRVVAVAAGATHSIALSDDGSVYTWGHNKSGQLGDGTKTDRNVAINVKGIANARAIAAGGGFSMVLEADGSVWAWGNNQSGQLGAGHAPIAHATPAKVFGLGSGSGVVEIAAGDSFALVRKSDGSVWAWGNGTSGQLGDGSILKRSAPTAVVGLGNGSGVVALSAGGAHSLVVKRDGTVWAWGNNQSGQLGDGKSPLDQHAPVQVRALTRHAVAVAAGASFSLALLDDGSVWAWGHNKSGQLGNGVHIQDALLPVAVRLPKGARVVAIAAGTSHSVALRVDGTALAWGNNSHGQLGDGTAPADHDIPVVVITGSK